MSVADPAIITHYSDLLCVWAYVGQVRVDELRGHFESHVVVRPRFCSVFGDVAHKLASDWTARGGLAGYRTHVDKTIGGFDHVTLHPDTWVRAVPTTSATAHAFVKAAELACPDGSPTERLAWRLRLAFFRDGRDISRIDVQLSIADELGLSRDAIRARLDDGSAWASVQRDYEDSQAEHVRGSPTIVMNEQRQILYGNVGYKIIEANVHELLRNHGDQASWC